MSFNGAGVFNINTAGQPVVNGTVISATVFNALTADLASGLSTCITKDGQTAPTANIPMAGFKFTGLGYGTSSTDSARVDNCNVLDMFEFRLTALSLVPIPTTDRTAVETIYLTPYKGNRIALYDGSKWVMRTSAEISIDVPDATNMYDVFVYDNSGVPTLELTAWTNDTTRATNIVLQDGVWVKDGALTRRYAGSFYCTTAGNGQTEDSVANRYLWNYYNRVPRPMRRIESTGTWAYTTATIREANGSSSNRLNFVVGVSEDPVSASLTVTASNTTGSPTAVAAIGVDSTTAFSTAATWGFGLSGTTYSVLSSHYKSYPGIGKHYLSWLEYSTASGTTNWFGTNSFSNCGLIGEILA